MAGSVRQPDQIGAMVSLAALRNPRQVALKAADGAETTYGALDERSTRLANALLGSGLEPGDRVAAWMDDGPAYVELYFAVAKAGLVMVPINRRFTVHEARHPMADSGARALVYSPGAAEGAEQLIAEHEPVLAVEDGPAVEELIAAGSAAPPDPPPEEAPFIIGYTSGTTGAPKGAVLTHRSVKNISRVNAQAYRLPLYSVAAFTGSMSFVATVPAFIMSHLLVGGSIVFLGRWDVESLLHAVERERATYTYIPSPRLVEFADAAERAPERWSSLVSILHSASKARPEHLRRLHEVVGDRLVEGWGMAENSGGLATATTAADLRGETEASGDVFASVGRAVVDTAIEVVGEDGRPLPHDGEQTGELLIRSSALFSGYWGNDEATRRALRDGWYHSGDLGAIDPAGYVYVSDRRSDLIVSGGMNVYPSEVETVIASLPGVSECAVVGAPHERWGQTVVAVVVRAPGADLDAEHVIDHCRERLASYKKPTRVVFVEALPRNTANKVLRRALEEQVMASA